MRCKIEVGRGAFLSGTMADPLVWDVGDICDLIARVDEEIRFPRVSYADRLPWPSSASGGSIADIIRHQLSRVLYHVKKLFDCTTSSRNIGSFFHFFTKVDASSSSRAPKRRVKVGSSSSSSRIKLTPVEIVILDSDDDDAPVVRAKRKAHAESSSSSSDVEVVETEGTTWTNLSRQAGASKRSMTEGSNYVQYIDH